MFLSCALSRSEADGFGRIADVRFAISFGVWAAYSDVYPVLSRGLRECCNDVHHCADPLAYDAWIADYRARLRREGSVDAERAKRMRAVNPLYVLRNHLAQRAIEQAEAGDFGTSERLLAALAQPFDERPEHAEFAGEPPPELRQIAVSCSS